MKIFGVIVIIVLISISSCQNRQNTNLSNDSKLLKEFIVERNGKNYHYFEDSKGVKKGLFSIEYANGELFRGYLKNGVRDSICRSYWKSRVIKSQSYYINGLENGYRYEYSNLGNEGESYFMENGLPKTKTAIYYVTKNSKKNIGYYKKSFYLQDSIWVYSGSLFLDTSFNVIQYDSISDTRSTFYNIEFELDSNRLLAINSNQTKYLKIRFYRLEKNSIIKISIGEMNNLKQGCKVFNHFQVDSTGLFFYKIKSKKQGWHFVRGEFEETIKDGQKRKVPVYFNYYLITSPTAPRKP